MNEFIQHFIGQLYKTSIVEWLGVITAFICIYLAAKNHILNWPISVISVISYIFLFYQSKLYGEIFLQFYFLFTAIYGWFFWKNKSNQFEQRPIVNLKKSEYVYVFGAIVLGTSLLFFLLKKFTDTNVPLTDAFCTAMSFTAQYLLTRKIIQNWILWVVVDIVYVPLFLYKDLYLSAVLYALLMLLALKGYFDWKKIVDKKQREFVK